MMIRKRAAKGSAIGLRSSGEGLREADNLLSPLPRAYGPLTTLLLERALLDRTEMELSPTVALVGRSMMSEDIHLGQSHEDVSRVTASPYLLISA
jgi:hypothetical protein